MAIVTTSRPSHVSVESAWFPARSALPANARVEDADVFDDDDTEVQYRVRPSADIVLERRCRTPNDTEEWTSVVSFDALVPAVECLSALLRQTRVQTVGSSRARGGRARRPHDGARNVSAAAAAVVV